MYNPPHSIAPRDVSAEEAGQPTAAGSTINTPRAGIIQPQQAACQQQQGREGDAGPINTTATMSQQSNGITAPDLNLLLPASDAPIGVDHVNWLLKACGVSQEDRVIDSLRQCSSSLFALVFQRIFNCTIPDLELEPNTIEKRLWNMQRVLEELQLFVVTDLSYIDAAQIVALNEEHISELIRVFFEIVIGFVIGGQQQGGLAHDQLTSHQQRLSTANPAAANANNASQNTTNNDDASQADSAHKTHRLVSSWKKGVVHPLAEGGALMAAGPARRGASSGGVTASSPTGATTSKPRPLLRNTVAGLHSRLNQLDALLVPPSPHHPHSSIGGGVDIAAGGGRVGRGGHQMRGGPRGASGGGVANAAAGASNNGSGSGSRRTRNRSAAATPTASQGQRGATPVGILKGASSVGQSAGAVGGGGHRRAASSSSQLAVARGGAVASGAVAPHSAYYDPYVTATTSFPPTTYSLVKTINTEARDIKIQQLKTMRFMSDVHQAMRADIVNKASVEQASIAGTAKGEQARIRRDTRDMMKYARDENERYKAAYECILMSARNNIEKCRALVDPKTLQIHERNAKATRAASVGVKAALGQQQDHENRRVERYYGAITTWRKGTIACM